MPLDPKVPYAEITYRIIGCAMRVHSRLGPGLREKMYQRAFTAEMRAAGLRVAEEYEVKVFDGDVWIGNAYPDHWVEDCIPIEDKAFPHFLTNAELAQILGYLCATNSKVGLLFNFGRKRLEYKRALPPKDVQGWQKKIARFLWRPKGYRLPDGILESNTASRPERAPSANPLSQSANQEVSTMATTTTRRIVCWKCDKLFRVDIDDVSATRVTVMRGIADTTGAKQKPKQKLVVKCPHCSAENDVRV